MSQPQHFFNPNFPIPRYIAWCLKCCSCQTEKFPSANCSGPFYSAQRPGKLCLSISHTPSSVHCIWVWNRKPLSRNPTFRYFISEWRVRQKMNLCRNFPLKCEFNAPYSDFRPSCRYNSSRSPCTLRWTILVRESERGNGGEEEDFEGVLRGSDDEQRGS